MLGQGFQSFRIVGQIDMMGKRPGRTGDLEDGCGRPTRVTGSVSSARQSMTLRERKENK